MLDKVKLIIDCLFETGFYEFSTKFDAYEGYSLKFKDRLNATITIKMSGDDFLRVSRYEEGEGHDVWNSDLRGMSYESKGFSFKNLTNFKKYISELSK